MLVLGLSKVQKKQDVNDKFFLQSGLVVTNFIERFIGCTLQSQIFTAFWQTKKKLFIAVGNVLSHIDSKLCCWPLLLYNMFGKSY